MSVFDVTCHANDLQGWRPEIVDRLREILDRKLAPAAAAGALSAGVRAVVERFENAVSLAGLKRALSELIGHLRKRGRAVPPEAADGAIEALHARIRAHGVRESIESYPQYLFTVQISL